ncbi:uroporphyrinogen-III synthase [Neptunitalea lumnitzerae]|uniref:Uroporphyrinogen III methyltransferase n=1 Tax=Neptunitalea lumnitzerae TaxID=2965509 RepID=A0ABQ5MFZ2_9FLAO|nr:uroporphyrinogen-III synthase [Neptunitalea sp. Y10]GLB48236.1 uroporphyrinogen III methyltransferase [Neptunitalea sp. Y10]
MNTIRILSTKVLSAAQQELLLNKGFALVQADFIKVAFTDIKENTVCNNVIISSKNGVLSLEHNNLLSALNTKTIYCVGAKTASLITSKALTVTKSFANSKELGNYLVAEKKEEKFTYFCGNIRRKEMPSLLKKNNIYLEEVVSYKTFFAPQEIPGKFDGVLFFSPSQAESFFFSNKLQNAIAFCIGTTTEDAIKPYTKNTITATQPTIENVIVKVVKHFNKELNEK